MSAPAGFYPLLQFELDKFLLEFQQQDKFAEAGVMVNGPSAAYALVWEWGNVRQKQIGPKTTLGTNPDGKQVFLSIQAPHGYIRVNVPLYWAAFEQEMKKVNFGGSTTGAIHDALQQVAEKVAVKIRDIIREHVPVDSGQLWDELEVAYGGDDVLDEPDTDGVLVLAKE